MGRSPFLIQPVMSEKLTEILLSGLSPDEFIILYLVAVVGIFVRWSYNIVDGVWFDPSTPYTFSFQYFTKGLIRLLTSLIVMAFVIARFYEFSDHVVNIATEHNGTGRATITAGGAFMVGLGIDEIVKRLVGRSLKKYKP